MSRLSERLERVGLRQSAVQICGLKAATENPLPGSGQSSVRTPDPEATSNVQLAVVRSQA